MTQNHGSYWPMGIVQVLIVAAPLPNLPQLCQDKTNSASGLIETSLSVTLF